MYLARDHLVEGGVQGTLRFLDAGYESRRLVPVLLGPRTESSRQISFECFEYGGK